MIQVKTPTSENKTLNPTANVAARRRLRNISLTPAAKEYRRHVILCCYILQVFCTVALLGLALWGAHHVFPIYAVLLVIGTGRAFSGPASSALLPHLVAEEHFVNAVTWGGAIFQFANVTGPALGGVLFTLPLVDGRRRAGPDGAGIVYIFTRFRWYGFSP